jgi:hypothetical protein
MSTLFFRLLKHEDKAAGLSEALDAVRQGHTRNSVVHVVAPASFQQVPGSPFAYWVSEYIRRLFTELPRFESQGREVRVGAILEMVSGTFDYFGKFPQLRKSTTGDHIKRVGAVALN